LRLYACFQQRRPNKIETEIVTNKIATGIEIG
jgi:hypothetical protein